MWILKKGGVPFLPIFPMLCGMVIKSNDGFYVHSLKKDMNPAIVMDFPGICQF